MNWSDFVFWWLEWPLKMAVSGILVVTLLLFLNNILLLLFRGAAFYRNNNGEYLLFANNGHRAALRAQFGPSGRFLNLFKWSAWFWFQKSE